MQINMESAKNSPLKLKILPREQKSKDDYITWIYYKSAASVAASKNVKKCAIISAIFELQQ